MQMAKRSALRSAGYGGEASTQASLNEDRTKNPAGGEAKDPREGREKDGCVVLPGRSHQGRPEAGDTPTMISHGVEISIAGGGADEKDGEMKGSEGSLYR